MRKVTLGLALASTALAAPAMARDGEWYAGIEGGISLAEDQDYTLGGAFAGDADVENDEGFDVDAILGYDFGMFRLEAEAAYKDYEPDTITLGALAGAPAGNEYDLAGHLNALSFMGNALLDFGPDDGLQGFIGAGAGIARVDIRHEIALGELLDDSDSAFAWQALAGVRTPLGDDWDLGLKYRYFNVPDLDFVSNAGTDVDTELHTHSLLASLIYNFGGEEEYVAPVVVPTPVQPVEPAPVVCKTGPYIVYFDWDQSDLTSQATSVLNNAVAQYANCGSASVTLAGHTDKSGTVDYNIGLSERRNETVKGYMISRGVPAGVISTNAYGESSPAVDTPDGVREPKNRRVEINYATTAGY